MASVIFDEEVSGLKGHQVDACELQKQIWNCDRGCFSILYTDSKTLARFMVVSSLKKVQAHSRYSVFDSTRCSMAKSPM
ncbi:hypothetical protein IRJ41_016408 [Triplophysa rosa]|uniref:Uncharacterized protein n=1 Tax=Triplophysa rosa TaxID=992332 RepID=A0A9W7WVB0_TRIRA|nr:hypothetical protein IRJ41_016408 [Triplophysa rosa]